MKAGNAGQHVADWEWQPDSHETAVAVASMSDEAGPGAGRTLARLLDDAVMALLVVWLIPVSIIVVGAPVALLARAVIEIAQRW